MFQYEPLSYDIAYQTQSNSLPPSALGYHTHNKYEGFPPLMSDGRTVTASFQPEAVLNEHLLRETGVIIVYKPQRMPGISNVIRI